MEVTNFDEFSPTNAAAKALKLADHVAGLVSTNFYESAAEFLEQYWKLRPGSRLGRQLWRDYCQAKWGAIELKETLHLQNEQKIRAMEAMKDGDYTRMLVALENYIQISHASTYNNYPDGRWGMLLVLMCQIARGDSADQIQNNIQRYDCMDGCFVLVPDGAPIIRRFLTAFSDGDVEKFDRLANRYGIGINQDPLNLEAALIDAIRKKLRH